jgi:tyrosyl-tRNA synthetase
MGGQDQWGNIVMGIELGRRLHQANLAGLTMPLITKADGGKFGKSEAGNIWLSAERTPVFEFYQFWRNVADSDAARFLGYFTFLPEDDLKRLGALEGQAVNEAKEVLAYEVTKLIHGEAAAQQAAEQIKKAVTGSDVTGDAVPHGSIQADELEAGVGLLTLMVRAGLAPSNGQARNLVQGGGVKIHDAKVDDPRRTVSTADLVDGYVLLRVGKKKLYRYDLAG